MNYATFSLEELNIDIKYSTFSSDKGKKEYHFVINANNPLSDFKEQALNIKKSIDYIQSKICNKQTTLVWCRYFLSDPINQYQYLHHHDCAVSLTGQAPLNYSKISVWCYFIENVSIINEKYLSIVKHSSYQHYFFTGLNDSSLHKNEYEQTDSIFSILKKSMDKDEICFSDELIRTWVYVQGVDTHYKGMVVARKELFDKEGLTDKSHYIASTGIEGRYIHPETLVYMDAYAIKGLKKEQIKYLQALTHLSPTHIYGVTFERGTEVQFGDRKHIFISGTASIDKNGEVVAPHDIIAQTQRTIENIEALLSEAKANFNDVAHLIIYLRDTGDYPLVKNYLESNYQYIPKIFVQAPVCRPGWLIEIECIAINNVKCDSFDIF